MELTYVDWLIMGVYFVFVLGMGFVLRRHVKSSTDFFLAGRAMPAWVASLAFISANLGAQEVIGMAASGAKYGISTANFYWVGAIPAMVFVGVFMMTFYYGSRVRSVPEYLRLRFDEKTRALNAMTFAIMTIFSSGISMYAMAQLIVTLHILDGVFQALGLPVTAVFHVSILISAAIVLGYITLGGLTSAIYNEVLQFFLIVAGLLPLVLLGLLRTGGWQGIQQTLPAEYTQTWAGMGSPSTNLMGVDWFSMIVGLGFVLSFGYWCTDFLVVQRALSAHDMEAARRTPLIAAVPKMFFPFLVILPGIIAIALPTLAASDLPAPVSAITSQAGAPAETLQGKGLIPVQIDETTGRPMLDSAGQPVLNYNLAMPNMLLHFFPTGLLGLGLTALLASFMSGMAGNVTAFNTVWTYDIYQSYIRRDAGDEHYLWMGRMATVFGVAASILAAYVAARFNNIMDLLQLVFAFVNAPLFATFLLGMFWRRTTGHGAFAGLLAGIVVAAVHHGLTVPADTTPGIHGGWIVPLHYYPSEMAQNFWTAIVAWTTCFLVTIGVSLLTKPRPPGELVGLVYSLTERPKEDRLPFIRRPAALGLAVLAAVLVLNILFF
jgi:SSS family solute:Na+ symporter